MPTNKSWWLVSVRAGSLYSIKPLLTSAERTDLNLIRGIATRTTNTFDEAKLALVHVVPTFNVKFSYLPKHKIPHIKVKDKSAWGWTWIAVSAKDLVEAAINASDIL